MWRPIGKVMGSPSLFHATCSFADRILLMCVALSTKLEVANKTLSKERATRQVADQALRASQETGSALTRDLQSAQAYAIMLKEELSAKSVTLDELVIQEREGQIRLQATSDEKKTQEQLLEFIQKTLSKQDFSSLTVISSVVAHVVVLLKSHMLNLDAKNLQRDFPFDNDEERDALVDSVYDTAQYFVFQYDFSITNESDDSGSPGA
jgi:hypothetical protein